MQANLLLTLTKLRKSGPMVHEEYDGVHDSIAA
jgi:hypothetical protein